MTKSIYEKSWIIEAQALKAAEKEGWSEAEARAQLRKDGKKYYFVNPAEAPTGARQAAEAAIKELQDAIPACRTEESCKLLLARLNDMAIKFKLAEAVVTALDEAIGMRAVEIEGEAELTRSQVKHAPGNKPGWVHASSVLKPTKLVWVIADEMYAEAQNAGKPMPTRKEVQDECVRRGIASGTARTQFQHWFKLHNENPERATIDPATGKIIPPAKK